MAVLFGTDGVRGVANRELTPEVAYRLGRAGAHALAQMARRPRFVVGRDTRISGTMLESALVAGILSTGADVSLLGVIPTPAVAYFTRAMRAQAGVVISASHNSMEDNGIKFFGGDGFKLPDEVETRIEELVLHADLDQLPYPTGAEVGRREENSTAAEDYLEHLLGASSRKLRGWRIVVDAANGAAFQVAPELWRRLGAEVIELHCQPDGCNINWLCGSTHPQSLQQAVIRLGADLGLAYDGDADRVLAVDERGQLVDGDEIMVICGLDLQAQRQLDPSVVVVTVMSNLGLHQALQQAGIEVRLTAVGDRYVLEEMQRCDALLGGEQSGHIIFRQYATTGDGLITSLQLVQALARSGKSLSELAAQMTHFPQELVNVQVKNKTKLLQHPAVREAITGAEEALGPQGRILVRPSGTEPLVRFMAEGPDRAQLMQVLAELVRVAEDQVRRDS